MDRAIYSHSVQNGLLGVLGAWEAGDGPIYRRLADALRTAVQRGDLAAGERMPAERILAEQLGISRSTVVAAYESLRDEELIERRQGSGTRVRERPSTNGRSPAQLFTRPLPAIRGNSLFRGLMDLPDATIDLIGAYLLDAGSMPQPALEGIDHELSAMTTTSGYAPLGYPPLRRAIADHFCERGLPTEPRQILITNGAQQAIYLVAWLSLQSGDVVLVENPTYPGALDVFNSLNTRVVGVPTRRNGVDLQALGESLARLSPGLAYIIPTYQNPMGTLLSAGGRRVLASLVEQHGVPLIEDDSLSGLGPDDDEPAPVAASVRGTETPVLTVGSLSKMCWGGLRIGWIRAPEAVVVRLGRLKAVADLGSPLPSQIIATRLIGGLNQIRRDRARCASERLGLITGLLQHWLPTWSWDPPRGGLCLWVRLPFGNAAEFAQVALRHGVSIVPGNVASPDGSFADHVRLPFGQEPAVLEEGIRRLAGAWEAYAETTAETARANGVAVVV